MCQGGVIAEGSQATTATTVRVVHIPATIAAGTTALMKPGAGEAKRWVGWSPTFPEPQSAVSKRFYHLFYRIFSGRHYQWLLRLKATFSYGVELSRVSSGKGSALRASSWLQHFLTETLEGVASSLYASASCSTNPASWVGVAVRAHLSQLCRSQRAMAPRLTGPPHSARSWGWLPASEVVRGDT